MQFGLNNWFPMANSWWEDGKVRLEPKGKVLPSPPGGRTSLPCIANLRENTEWGRAVWKFIIVNVFFFHFCIHLMGLKFYGGLICTSSVLRTPLKLSETLFPWVSSWSIWNMGISSSNTDPEKTEAPIYFYCTFVYRKAVLKPSSKEEIALSIPGNLKCFYDNQLFTI